MTLKPITISIYHSILQRISVIKVMTISKFTNSRYLHFGSVRANVHIMLPLKVIFIEILESTINHQNFFLHIVHETSGKKLLILTRPWTLYHMKDGWKTPPLWYPNQTKSLDINLPNKWSNENMESINNFQAYHLWIWWISGLSSWSIST